VRLRVRGVWMHGGRYRAGRPSVATHVVNPRTRQPCRYATCRRADARGWLEGRAGGLRIAACHGAHFSGS
jgi:hypothetical protein